MNDFIALIELKNRRWKILHLTEDDKYSRDGPGEYGTFVSAIIAAHATNRLIRTQGGVRVIYL